MIPDGATIMCGGFLACGQARAIVKELVKPAVPRTSP